MRAEPDRLLLFSLLHPIHCRSKRTGYLAYRTACRRSAADVFRWLKYLRFLWHRDCPQSRAGVCPYRVSSCPVRTGAAGSGWSQTYSCCWSWNKVLCSTHSWSQSAAWNRSSTDCNRRVMSRRPGRSPVLNCRRSCAGGVRNHGQGSMQRRGAGRRYQILPPILWSLQKCAGWHLHFWDLIWPDRSYLPSPHTTDRRYSLSCRQNWCGTSLCTGNPIFSPKHPEMPRNRGQHGWIHRLIQLWCLLYEDCHRLWQSLHSYRVWYRSLYNPWYCNRVCQTQRPGKNRWHWRQVFWCAESSHWPLKYDALKRRHSQTEHRRIQADISDKKHFRKPT